jgi:hypothetical protein
MSEKTKPERVSKLKRAVMIAAGALGVTGSVAGIAHMGNETVAGAPTAVERHVDVGRGTEAANVLRSSEREAAIDAQATQFSSRIIADAVTPPSGHRVEFLDEADGKKDGRGTLTDVVQADGKMFTFKVKVKQNTDGSFAVDDGSRYIEAISSAMVVRDGEQQQSVESVVYERADEADAAWRVAFSSMTMSSNGQASEQAGESGPVNPDPNVNPVPPSPDAMLATEHTAAAKFNQLLQDAQVN